MSHKINKSPYCVLQPMCASQEAVAMAKGPVYGTPMYVALVDVCGSDDYLELVKSALQAALEAMPAGALFGLVTFSNRVRIAVLAHCV